MSEKDKTKNELKEVLDSSLTIIDEVLKDSQSDLTLKEVGTVLSVSKGIATIKGLPHVCTDELLLFPGNTLGIVFNLDKDQVDIVLLDKGEDIAAGSEVRRTGRVLDVPVGESLLGRTVDALGRPLDNGGPIQDHKRMPIEREAPAIMDRAPVSVPLQTGIQVIDALIPVGRGQRELIVGDRQTGKTAIAVDTIINQKDKDVLCIYCAIGKEGAAVSQVIADLKKHQALDYTIVVVAKGEDTPGLNFVAPYVATTMGEYFMDQGKDVLVVFDDLIRHARSYRELSLLLRRPPAREAYPGDIFYIHSRLLERSTHLREEKGGGSLTTLPIVEIQAQNISAYIPTNLISITDGQIYCSPKLSQKGILPAIDVGLSVSRVGGKTQLPAYRTVAGDLRLVYSQFEELEAFARFGTRLDEKTRQTLERGKRLREVLKQSQYQPVQVPEQIAVLLAVTQGLFDPLSIDVLSEVKRKIYQILRSQLPDVCQRILNGEKFEQEDQQVILDLVQRIIDDNFKEEENANSSDITEKN